MSFYVFVTTKDNKPLSPTTIERAASLNRAGKGTFFKRKGVLCLRLNYQPTDTTVTNVVSLGVDPGSKWSGITACDAIHTYLNLHLSVSKFKGLTGKMESRRDLRRGRRYRNTPYRKARFNNRSRKYFLPPSTKARWQYHYNWIKFLTSILPVAYVVIEDVCGKTMKNGKKWNEAFSPIQCGKNWFYTAVKSLGVEVDLVQGYTTKELRDKYSLKKTTNKSKLVFEAHNVDAWVLAQTKLNEVDKPDITLLHLHTYTTSNRRQLHEACCRKGGYKQNKKLNLGFPPKCLLFNKRSTGTYYRKTGNYIELLVDKVTKKQERLDSLQVKSYNKQYLNRL
jgi:hypothetical protein